MSMKKSMKVLAALLVLAALATPTFAIEHEISGRFASFFAATNYSHDGALQNSPQNANWFDQRLRLAYTAKADANVKLVTKFELDYAFWGNSSYTVGRGSGGAIGADSVNLETKNIYLDWTIPSMNLNATVGMQGYGDVFSNILFGSDMAGILLNHSYTNANASVGFFRWEDGGGTVGRYTQDLVVVDGQYNVNSDLKIGAAYYYIMDGISAAESKVHTFGLTGQMANVSAFVFAQTGDYNATTDAKGYAAKIAANLAIGTGTLRGDILYAAGGKNQLYVTRDGVGYYDNEMMMLSRDKNQTSIDNALIYDLNNRGEGAILLAIGFDQPFSSTLTGSVNLGFGMVADNQGTRVVLDPNLNPLALDGGNDTIGTEINFELVKKATDNITLSGRAGYLFLGDHYIGDLDDLYCAQVMIAYAF